jgi:potassium channel subfamily K
MLVTVYGALRGHYNKEFQLTMSQRTLMLQTISFLVYLLAGAALYSHIEGWKYLDAVYWADFTLLTVGIGDYAPSTHLGRGLLFPFAIGGISSYPYSTPALQTNTLQSSSVW